jgi:hypothetical protein
MATHSWRRGCRRRKRTLPWRPRWTVGRRMALTTTLEAAVTTTMRAQGRMTMTTRVG